MPTHANNPANEADPAPPKLLHQAEVVLLRSATQRIIRLADDQTVNIIQIVRALVAKAHSCRSTNAFLSVAISFAGLRPFGQAFEQFMMVWQR
jgi:hypothetical protein